jgi:transcriptional regulator with XRE-family HTH domain
MSDLRTWKAASGRNWTWLAGQVGTTPSHISDIARGHKEPSLGLAIKIADVTGVPVRSLRKPEAA